MPEGAFCILVSKFCFRSLSHCSLFINCSYSKSFIAFSSHRTFFIYHFSSILYFSLFRMYSRTSGTCLFLLFSLFACILLPLAHTYFFFFLFSHVFTYLWHIPISSFFSFRMCLLTSGTYLIHNFPLSRMYSLTSGTYLIHNFTLSRMYSRTTCTYLVHLFSFFACIPLPLAHT